MKNKVKYIVLFLVMIVASFVVNTNILASSKEISNVDEYNNKLKKEQKQLQEEMTQIAEQISEIRKSRYCIYTTI